MKRFRIYLVIMSIFMMSYGSLSAQNQRENDSKQNNPEQRIELRVQRMQKVLKLNEEKAAQFNPLYKEYLQNILLLKKQESVQRDKNMTDEQIDQLVINKFEKKEKLIDIQKQYYLKFRNVLTSKQARKALSLQNHKNKNKK